MQVLPYRTPGTVNAFRWRRFFWQQSIWICVSCAIISGPVCVNAALNSPPMSEMFGRLRWETVITISVAAQVLSLALWMGILFGLMFDERPLGKVEESMLPLTLVLLVLWFIMDVLVSACCWMSEIGL